LRYGASNRCQPKAKSVQLNGNFGRTDHHWSAGVARASESTSLNYKGEEYGGKVAVTARTYLTAELFL